MPPDGPRSGGGEPREGSPGGPGAGAAPATGPGRCHVNSVVCIIVEGLDREPEARPYQSRWALPMWIRWSPASCAAAAAATACLLDVGGRSPMRNAGWKARSE